MKRLIYTLILLIPLLSACVSDDCSECADMAYDTKVRLNITWPKTLSQSTTKLGNEDLSINNFTLFVFNTNGTLNTVKKVNLATSPILYTHSVTLNITSSAKFIYAIANCEDILTDSPSSTIGKLINQNMGSLKNFFDYILATSIDSLFEDSQLLLTGLYG
ncbi:MAG: fimbrial protein [Bacteroidales bacterium]|nr:fimbrial protein [Bacteroidales bacterium]MDD4702733.1 fimbrial protein [Bacteroidales bacterium]